MSTFKFENFNQQATVYSANFSLQSILEQEEYITALQSSGRRQNKKAAR